MSSTELARTVTNKVFAHLPSPVRNRLSAARHSIAARRAGESNAAYWARHNVTSHQQFASREESLERLHWRNGQYLFYGDWLPYDTMTGKTVLDYGCGPGDDLVAVAEWAHPSRLIGADVSTTSLEEARKRLELHPEPRPELLLLDDSDAHVPLEDGSVDVVVSSGVLHHCPNVGDILDELRRVLAPDGVMHVMVYNRDSVFANLYVPYIRQIVERVDAGASLEEAFKRSTDGPSCPYSVAYTPYEFTELAAKHGFAARFHDAAVAMAEMRALPRRFDAILDSRLAAEHREFLARLTFDDHGRPHHNGQVAGIDGLFELRPA